MPNLTLDRADLDQVAAHFTPTTVDCHVRVRSDYSGRSMFGAQCIAIEFDALYWLPVIVMRVATQYLAGDTHADFDDLQTVMLDLTYTQQLDSMGVGNVVYWPNLTLAN